MLNRPQKTKSEGFTIIEVLIVLAIAGLIMLIVLLAVPALQRNSRNTSRKNDVGRTASAVQTVLSNNNGALAQVTSANVRTELTNLSYYETTNVSVAAWTNGVTNTTTVDTIRVLTGSACGNNGNPARGTTRQIAVLYTVETNVKQCQEV